MSSPRHLWSGDWRLESAAAAEELARRRGRSEARALPEPEARVRPEAKAPGRPRRRRPGRRVVRAAALIGLATLLCAGAAYGMTSLLSGSSTAQTASGGGGHTWLGADVASIPVGGVLVTHVAPDGPADRAGLRPGDVIAEVAGQRVGSPADVASALAPLHPGQRVEIELDRGPGTYVTDATLQARVGGSP